MATMTVVHPNPDQGLQSQAQESSSQHTLEEQEEATWKLKRSKRKHLVFTQGLHLLQHFSCDSPVRFMMFSKAAAAYISLHSDNTVSFYTPDGQKQTPSATLTFTGLTETKTSGRLVGWGPGPVFTLLDDKLRPLEFAPDALDIRVCQAAEHSEDIVVAGAGNVCMWSVMLMRCKVRIEEGLKHKTFTQMALSPPHFGRPHRAFVVYGRAVTVVDLDGGTVLEHKRNLCSEEITAIVFCSQLDCLITASREPSIQTWGQDWEQRSAFKGCDGVVNSLFYCPALSMLLSAAKNCTICCWTVEEGDTVARTEQKSPPMFISGTGQGETFFSTSHQGVDFWSIRNLHTLHCTLSKEEKAPLRQILVTSFPAPFPIRVLCVSDSKITLLASETGAVLTSFEGKQKILCAEYCIQKEILLVLTEEGTVLQANTLTNPATLMEEWRRKGQGPWRRNDHVTEDDAKTLPIPGPACCMVLYCNVTETQDALEEWKDLQDQRGSSRRNKKALDDAKNTSLIILGQSRGCLNVLKFNNGEVLCRTPAHSGQRVTALQAYPENSCLLSTGEDKTLVVWGVNPFVQYCLSQQMSLHCGQPHAYLAALGPQLAITFQEPNTSTYKLKYFNLPYKTWANDPSMEGHLDYITGLCVCPDLEVFVSSSADRTVCIWDEKNQLISKLQLNAVPECLAYSGVRGELLLGIKGDLYKISCTKFMPPIYQRLLLFTYYAERVKEKCCKRQSPSTDRDEDVSQAIASNLLLNERMWRQKDCKSLSTLNKDLYALLEGSVTCRKEKPPSTNQTKKDAFDRFMKILYQLPLDVKIDLEDLHVPDELSFCPQQPVYKLYGPPLKKDPTPEPQDIPLIKETVQEEETKAPETKPKRNILTSIKPLPVLKVTPKRPTIVEKKLEKEKSPVIIPPIDPPKPPTPTPRRRWKRTPPKAPTSPSPREPSPEVPTFLKQFAEADWFKELFPDRKGIPSTLSPDDFSLQLLGCLNTCTAASKIKILATLQTLHRQEILPTMDKLYQGLTDLVPKLALPHMSTLEGTVLVEMLKLLTSINSVNNDLVKKFLTLLAYKKVGLRKTWLGMLTALGVDDAEQWLWPELETWDSELRDQSNIWQNLHDKAEQWLALWISKYEEHERFVYLSTTAKWTPPTFSVVDVLNYFCSVRKEEHRRARCVVPTGRKNTVLLPLYDCSSQPILRLGETYSMTRARRSPEVILPPLRLRPFLMHFPNFISFPLPQVTLRPFHIYSEEDWVKASTRRYFVHQQSFVKYYRY